MKTDGQFSVILFWRKVTGKILAQFLCENFILSYFIANTRKRTALENPCFTTTKSVMQGKIHLVL